MSIKNDVFSFIHLSDPHIPETREGLINGVQPYEKLECTVKSITQLEYKPRFAIITGDLSHKGTTQGYRLLKQYIVKLEEIGIPTLLTLGNNDNRENFREIFQTEIEKGPHYYSSLFGEIRVIALDSLVPGLQTCPTALTVENRRPGNFTGDQLIWLQNVLHRNPEQPTIIAFHHPMNMPSLIILDRNYDSSQRNSFYQILEGCNVLAILNGHLHHNQTTLVNGVLHCQASSTYAELIYNDEEFWVRNTSSYNQIIYQNKALYVKTLAMPSDGRIIRKGSIQQLIEPNP